MKTQSVGYAGVGVQKKAGALNKGCEWKHLFMSLAGPLHQEEQGEARAGWRGEEEQARGPLSRGGWGGG